jgi:hypothetical protein
MADNRLCTCDLICTCDKIGLPAGRQLPAGGTCVCNTVTMGPMKKGGSARTSTRGRGKGPRVYAIRFAHVTRSAPATRFPAPAAAVVRAGTTGTRPDVFP